MDYKEIKLVPNTTDYKTWVETTDKALGKWNARIDYSKYKPNMILLGLLNLK